MITPLAAAKAYASAQSGAALSGGGGAGAVGGSAFADMVKGAIIAAAEDLDSAEGKARRETLVEMAASV